MRCVRSTVFAAAVAVVRRTNRRASTRRRRATTAPSAGAVVGVAARAAAAVAVPRRGVPAAAPREGLCDGVPDVHAGGAVPAAARRTARPAAEDDCAGAGGCRSPQGSGSGVFGARPLTGPVVNVWLTGLHGSAHGARTACAMSPSCPPCRRRGHEASRPASPFGMPEAMPGSVAWVGDRRHPAAPGRGGQRRPHG